MKTPKKLLSIIITFVFAFITIASTFPVQAVTKIVLPKPVLAAVKNTYTFNSPIIFNLTCVNYSKNVQYRVVLYNRDKKISNDLYGGYVKKYFKSATPFQVKFTPPIPGNYGVEVYVKRAGYKGYYKYYDGFASRYFTVTKSLNSALNSELKTYFNLFNTYGIMSACACVNTDSLSANGGSTNNITVIAQDKTGSVMYDGLKAKIFARGRTLTGNDATYFGKTNTLFGKVSVDGRTLNKYIAGKISTESQDTIAFFTQMNATNYYRAFDNFGTDYDTYDKALAFLYKILPNSNSINTLKYDNTLTLSKIYANNATTPFYDNSHKEISISKIKTELGISSSLKETSVKYAFKGKKLKFVLTDSSNTNYTYVVTFN